MIKSRKFNFMDYSRSFLIKSFVLPRLGTEVLSLTHNQIYSSTNQSTNIDLKLPNSMFINGIVLFHDVFPTCDKIETGKIFLFTKKYSLKI